MQIARIVMIGALAAVPAGAATVNVTTNGADDPACGGKSAPCRTLSQAIANAAAGDKVVVGPGRYGDVDGDGVLGGPGEEPVPAGDRMIEIDKPLAILSREGAGATILDAGGAIGAVLFIEDVTGVTIGKRKRGFTITGAFGTGVSLNEDHASTDHLRLEGNRLVANGDSGCELCGGDDHVVRFNHALANGGHGISLCGGAAGERHQIIGNTAIGNAAGFSGTGTGSTFKDNLALGNRGAGFHAIAETADADSTFRNNAASHNQLEGFHLRNDHALKGNVANGNGAAGMLLQDNGGAVSKNALVGNRGPGLELTGSPAPTITKNSIFGNGTDGATNCGIDNGTGATVDAPKNFWGAATGPGADPADATCGANAVTTAPVATKEIKVKVKAAQ